MAIHSKSSRNSSQQQRVNEIPLDFAVGAIDYINKMPKLSVEPLYDLTDENISKLHDLIEFPFVSFAGIEKYRTLETKAAAIFCITIRGHKFGNGNKRTAVMLLLLMLYVNAKWITISWTELYNLAMKVAKETSESFETQIEKVAKALSEKVIALEEAR